MGGSRPEKAMAYLISRYPAVSHTFILREVVGLRALGWRIETASINEPDRSPSDMTETERAEAVRTYVIKRTGIAAMARAHLGQIARSPRRYVRALAYAVLLADWNLSRVPFMLAYFVEAVLVASWMHRTRTIHLHVHFATPAATVGLIAAQVAPIRFSFSVHGPDEFYDVPGYALQAKVSGAAFVRCIGSFAQSQLMLVTPPTEWPKFEIVPLGVDTGEFTPRPPAARGEVLEVLCVGRLVPAKGQAVLVDAVARLNAQGRGVRLRFVGDGPGRQALERCVAAAGFQDWVVFEGAVNQDRIRCLYRQADLFVLPSFAEGIPVVLMEAMAMEIPCVSSWVAGIPELIRPEQDGILVPPSDSRACADAIARLQDDPALCGRLGAAGRLRVADRYELGRNIVRLAEVFERRMEFVG